MKNQTLNTLEHLRTTHWDFNEKPVPDSDIQTIIEHSMRAANSDNLTDYSVLVVRDPETLSFISGGESMGKAVTCLVYLMDHTRIVRCARALGYTDFKPLTQLYNFNIAMFDVCAAAQTAVIAAKSLGIDALVTNFLHRGHIKQSIEKLKLPKEYCLPIICVVLGYSDKDPEELTGRIDSKHIIHYETYRPVETIDTDEIIQNMDAVYPGHISDECPHALDWYFTQWFGKEWYTEQMYAELYQAYKDAKLMFPCYD